MIPKYVRSQDHISKFKKGATGLPILRRNLINALGFDKVNKIDQDIYDYGSYIIPASKTIYQDILKEFLDKNNITYDQLNQILEFSTDLRIIEIRHSYSDWISFCNYFKIDIISFGFN